MEATIVYTDGACINNGYENARAGSGVWYDDNDPRNLSARVAYKEQSNQTGELVAVLSGQEPPPGRGPAHHQRLTICDRRPDKKCQAMGETRLAECMQQRHLQMYYGLDEMEERQDNAAVDKRTQRNKRKRGGRQARGRGSDETHPNDTTGPQPPLQPTDQGGEIERTGAEGFLSGPKKQEKNTRPTRYRKNGRDRPSMRTRNVRYPPHHRDGVGGNEA